MTALAELFPPGDFRLHLTLRRGEPDAFFRARDDSGQVLAERRRWLASDPARYSALQPDAEPLLDEFAGLLAQWGAVPTGGEAASDGTPPARLRHLGARLEPDFLLLAQDPAGQFRLRGGALCFPTSWALEEKLGHTLDEIHAPVPGLNTSLGAAVRQFLGRLKPGVGYLRDNWGIAATDALNLHPSRGLPPPMPPVVLSRLWLRIEDQLLLALPRTAGVLFAIRIRLVRLDDLAGDRAAAAGLARALATMPEDLRGYKRVDLIWRELCALLE